MDNTAMLSLAPVVKIVAYLSNLFHSHMQKVEQEAILRIRVGTDWEQSDNVRMLRGLCQVCCIQLFVILKLKGYKPKMEE